MTPLKPDSPLVRITDQLYQGRRIVVELHPRYLLTYPEGRRRSGATRITYDAIYETAVKMEVRQDR